MNSPLHIVVQELSDTTLLYPFSALHCVWEVRCGALRLFEKVQCAFPSASLSFVGRDVHTRSFLARTGVAPVVPVGNTLVLDAAVVMTAALSSELSAAMQQYETAVFTVQQQAVGFWNVQPNAVPAHTPLVEVHAQRIVYLWDALSLNARALADDSRFFAHTHSPLPEGVFAVAPDNLFLGAQVSIGACTVLDASEGPIIIADHARVMPHSTVLGPCFVGAHAIVKVGAKIYGETSIGEWCKVGGEVENSIVHAYSNKQHDGFLGHSYLGEWVNLGADTNTSDLKNNYGSIRTHLRSLPVDTGRMFLGLLCGDHSKSAINTMFNTGTVVGVSANIFGGDFPPKSIPSFSWGGKADSPRFELDKAVDLARTVMARRKRVLLAEEEELLRLEWAKSTL